MTQTEVTMVRAYCTEKGGQHRKIIDLLHQEHRVAGVTRRWAHRSPYRGFYSRR